MILYSSGRYTTIRPPEEDQGVVESELSGLSAAEKEALKHLLIEMGQGSDAEVSRVLGLLDTEMIAAPVNIHTFVHDPYYLGNTCDSLYPKWESDMVQIFKHKYTQCVYSGSIGSGKTFSSTVALCYYIYLISLMKDPHRTLGIAPGSSIDIVVLSRSEDLAIRVAFDNIVSKIGASPYFKKHFPYKETKKELSFPNHVTIVPRATSDMATLGLNVIAAYFDEANFVKNPKNRSRAPGDDLDRAQTIYEGLVRRMKSRFQGGGKMPGIFFIVSSKGTHESFTERLIAENKNSPDFWVSDYSTWMVKKEGTFSSKKFYVLVGNESVPSKILPLKEELEYVNGTYEVPEGCIIDAVPEDYRRDFERSIEASIKEIAGLAVVAVSPYIQRREKLVEAVELYRSSYGNAEHPFSTLEYQPGTPGEMLWSKLAEPTVERTVFEAGGVVRGWRPKINPRATRHAHADPSLRHDRTGFCLAHISGYKDVHRRAPDGREYGERAPIYTVDFLLRIVPPLGGELQLAEITHLIYDFSAHGFSIGKVTTDQYQAAGVLQTLAAKGYSTDRQSVDISMDPYENLKTALYEGRVLFYDYEPLLDELRTIVMDYTRRKVDHPDNNSKDVSDALAGCLYTLSQQSLSVPVPIYKMSVYDADPSAIPDELVLESPGRSRFNTVLPPMLIGGTNGGWGGNEGGNGGSGWESF